MSVLSLIGLRASVQAFLERSLIFWSNYTSKSSSKNKKSGPANEKDAKQLRADLSVIAEAPGIVAAQVLAIVAAGWAGAVPLVCSLAAGIIGHKNDPFVSLVLFLLIV